MSQRSGVEKTTLAKEEMDSIAWNNPPCNALPAFVLAQYKGPESIDRSLSSDGPTATSFLTRLRAWTSCLRS